MKRFAKKSLAFLAAGMMCVMASAQDKALPVEFSGIVCTEVNTNFEGRWNNANLMFLTAKAPLWQGATFTGELGGFHDIGMEKHGGWWSVANDRQYFTNLPIGNFLTLSQFNITQQILDNLSAKFGVFKAGEFFVTPTNSLFLNTSIVTPPVFGNRWYMPCYHQQALGLNLTWEIVPGLTVKNSLFNGVASRQWSRVLNFRPGHDGIMDIAQVIYKDADDDNYIGEYRAGIAYADALQPGQIDKHKSTAWMAHIDQPVVTGAYPVAVTLGGVVSKEKVNYAYQYYNAGAVVKNVLLPGSRLGVNLCRAYFSDGVHESDVEVEYALPIFKNVEIQPGVHFIRTSGESTTAALVRASIFF